MSLILGNAAPEISLPDKDGIIHSLKDYKGEWILVYFYPRDNTPGCTKEACAMRDAQPDFEKLNATVFGISTDSKESHTKFSEKHDLNFILLADEKKEAVKAYEVYGIKKMMGREYIGTKRMSFLIDPNGNLAKIYTKVKPVDHAKQVLADIKELS